MAVELSEYIRVAAYREGSRIERNLLSTQPGQADILTALRRKVKDTMENFDAPFDDNYEIDPEIWLQYLLFMNSDKKEKEKLFKRIMMRTGLPYEKIELLLDCTLNFMASKARAN